MLPTYEEYCSMPLSLTLEEMAALYGQMAEEITDADAMDLYGGLLTAAVRYAHIRGQWPLWDREKKMEEDTARTSCHNRVIDSFNILARYLKKQGKPVLWRDALGDVDKNPSCRKRIGDFACYLVFVESLCAR